MSRRIEEESARATPASAERTQALSMHGEGKLDELSLSEALTAGRRAFVLAALSVRAGLPEAPVHSTMSSGNARAVTALAWQAGLDMELATQQDRKRAGE